MIGINQHEIGIKRTGNNCTVPSNNIVKLMYYLGCVSSLVEYNIPYNLRDYSNYNSLSFDQENAVIALALLLSPDIFVENNVMVNSSALCQGSSNEFYEITSSRTTVAASRQIIIAGKQVRTLKIMAFQMSWMENNYINPMNYFETRIKAIANGTVDQMNPARRQITYQRPQTNYNDEYDSYRSYKRYKKKKKCNIF